MIRAAAYEAQLKDIKDTLADFGVAFDVFFSEQELHDAGAIESAVARLREQGHVFDDGGAVWLRTTDFGDDKDRVMIRANGEPTYFAADAAYYLSKKDRGYTEKIYLLGADHHGYINRLKAIAAAAGDDPEVNIEVLIGQLVSVNGAKLSKRAGNIIELKDLISWLGKDAVRYSLARFPADSPLTLDPELLKKHTNENPVFYVQYAHARSRGAARNAVAAGVDRQRLRRLAAGPRHRKRAAVLPGQLPLHRGQGRGTPRAAPRGPPPRGHRRRLPPLVRRLPGGAAWATSPSPTSTAPGCGSTTPPARCWPTDWNCWASRRRNGCDRCMTRTAHRCNSPPPRSRPGVARRPRGPQRPPRAHVGRRRAAERRRRTRH